jgi:hypothetical protein
VSQLYFLHIPKTAGSSLTRLLEDSWPAGALAPQRFVNELSAVPSEELGRYELVAGHHGVLPMGQRTRVITILREPAERAWSHYRAHQRLGVGWGRGDVPSFESFAAFIDDPLFQWMARDYQARWLAVAPEPEERRPVGLPPGSRRGTTPTWRSARSRRCGAVRSPAPPNGSTISWRLWRGWWAGR